MSQTFRWAALAANVLGAGISAYMLSVSQGASTLVAIGSALTAAAAAFVAFVQPSKSVKGAK